MLPAKVLATPDVSDKTMFAVFLLNVNPVDAIDQTDPVPDNVQVPEPMVNVLVAEPVDENPPTVTLKLLALNVPDESVNVRPLSIVNALPNVHVAVEPLLN